MPKLAQRTFTDTYLRSLKVTQRKDCYDAAQPGFGLRVSPAGTKTWFVMHARNRHNLGRYPNLGLAEARQKCAQLLASLSSGRVPKSRALSLGQAMEDWFERDQKGKRGIGEKRRTMNKDVLPKLGQRKLNSITKAEIRDLLDGMVARDAPIHANRLLAYLRRFFNWAVETDFIDKAPTDGLKPPAKETSRERVLTKNEMSAVWSATVTLGYPWGPFFQLLILTGQRRNEVAGIGWQEIDLKKGKWTIPGSRAKNGKAHLVHLCDEAVSILSSVPRKEESDLVFTTTGTTSVSGFSKAKRQLDKSSGITDWRIHDLRRTFATVLTGELGVQPAVVDKILNHSSGAVTGIAAVYQRAEYLEQRKEAMRAWGDLVVIVRGGNA